MFERVDERGRSSAFGWGGAGGFRRGWAVLRAISVLIGVLGSSRMIT